MSGSDRDVDDDQLGPERLGQPTTRVQHRRSRVRLVDCAENPVSHHPSPSRPDDGTELEIELT
jgi:hypothetical protein